jgi:hypothetical protein
VCTIVVQKCVDSNTGLPLTFGVVERALREVHFAVHLAKAAKQQALAAIKILEQSFPICRAKMRLRVELSATADCALVRCLQSTPTFAPAAAPPRFSRVLQLIQLFDSVESNEVGRDGVRVVKGLCKSENFRSLDHEVQCHSINRRVISTDISFCRRARHSEDSKSSTSPLTEAARLRLKSFCSSSCSKYRLQPLKRQTPMQKAPRWMVARVL